MREVKIQGTDTAGTEAVMIVVSSHSSHGHSQKIKFYVHCWAT